LEISKEREDPEESQGKIKVKKARRVALATPGENAIEQHDDDFLKKRGKRR